MNLLNSVPEYRHLFILLVFERADTTLFLIRRVYPLSLNKVDVKENWIKHSSRDISSFFVCLISSHMSKSRWFTLVELMVVIAIIAILAASLYPSMWNYFSRARDANRKAVLNSLFTGISAYQIDKDRLPYTVWQWCDPQSPECAPSWAGPYNYLSWELVPNYIKQIPVVTSKTNFGYFVHDYRGYYNCPVWVIDTIPNSSKFSLYTPLENPTEKDQSTLSEVFDICLSNGWYSEFDYKMTN
jgi:prepilin-type N-terminal cleavage/methylation domain-containing protein